MLVKQIVQPESTSASVSGLLSDPRLVIVIILALLVGLLAYQAPPQGNVAIGWPGDRLFLDSSAGLGQRETELGRLYADELTGDARSLRSRWTRQQALLRFPGLGGDDLRVTLRLQGWPEDALNRQVEQPLVTVFAGRFELARFTPDSNWRDYELQVLAEQREGNDLALRIVASDTFTATLASSTDPRPKGIRLEQVWIAPLQPVPQGLQPVNWPTVAQLALLAVLAYVGLRRLLGRPTAGFVLLVPGIGAAAVGLALWRVWAAPLFGLLLWLVVALLILAYAGPFLRYAGLLLRRSGRGTALSYGLLAAALIWLIAVLGRAALLFQLPQLSRINLADAILYGALGTTLSAWILLRFGVGMPAMVREFVRLCQTPRGAMTLLVLLGGAWLGYLALAIADLPHIGHADYADNAVVARNLLAGRGWTVDYVTQFYRLYDGVTRPQETWPLLQPVWIVPFFWMFGPQTWAAKLPNLVFDALLLLLIFNIGTAIWDRRVGLTAALITLTSYLFFRLTIYPTHDLAQVVFSMAAIWTAYQVVLRRAPWWMFGAAGVLCGLMMLQKPSGALIGFGIAVWMLLELWRRQKSAAPAQLALVAPAAPVDPQLPPATVAAEPAPAPRLARQPPRSRLRTWLTQIVWPILVWGVIASLVLSPYLIRNLRLFGSPVYSTESYDAWVLGFTNWDAIYSIYTSEAGLPGLGVPDRSYILRWGFDSTANKIGTQILALRNYLLPALPWIEWSRLLAGREDKDDALLFNLGAWLALLGVLVAAPRRPALARLLVLAFTPYTLLMLFYWRSDEQRYWLLLLPWLAIGIGIALWSAYDKLSAIHNGRWAPLALALVLASLAGIILPSLPDINDKLREEPRLWAADLDVYDWLRTQTDADAVMMARNPWQLNWHAERPALMIPNTSDPATLLRVARYYGVEYLVLESVNRPEPPVQRMLEQMIADAELGFTLVYRTAPYAGLCDRRPCSLIAEVYRFPEPDLAEGQP